MAAWNSFKFIELLSVAILLIVLQRFEACNRCEARFKPRCEGCQSVCVNFLGLNGGVNGKIEQILLHSVKEQYLSSQQLEFLHLN